jgi:hypothetical protein
VTSPVRQLTAIRYHRDRPWDAESTANPRWDEVVAAIRRMDDHFYPIVQLNCGEHDDDETIFNVIGGNGRFALFHMMGDWQYSDANGSDEEVRLWTSDQGYFCAQRNILTDMDKVLRIVKVYYETGSYADLDAVA